MATRYAGDYFGISLEEDTRGTKDTIDSQLVKYFPGLREFSPKSSAKQKDGAVAQGGFKVPTEFAGFKTFEEPKPSR
jgi:hypothetical protein